MRRHRIVLILSAALLGMLALPAPAQPDDGPFGDDTFSVGTSSGPADNTRTSVELSAATFTGTASTVTVGRDDVFADSLASASLQADGPLLLVPSTGSLPDSVVAEIERLAPGRIVILGGLNAIDAQVEAELRTLASTVDRVAGPSRIETAIEVAREAAPASTTALLARAAGVEGNETAGFADALAAGGWAAEEGWPVLLSQTEVLTGSTRDYLEASAITEVRIMGGTAAISDAVVGQLDEMGIATTRVAGPDRAATAVEVAKARDAESAADVGRVIAVDGFSQDAWAAGFASAARSAVLDAPIVLGNVESLPPATEEWLAPGPSSITCALTDAVCDLARIAIGFDAAVPVPLPAGSLTYTVADGDSSAVLASTFDGEHIGLAHPCATNGCTQIDWTDDGSFLALVEDGGNPVALAGETLGSPRILRNQADGDRVLSIDAFTDDRGQLVGIVTTTSSVDVEIVTRVSEAGQLGTSGARGVYASFQALDDHPNGPGQTSALLIEPNGDLYARTGSFEFDLGLQRRPGAEVVGAAWNPDGSGHLAVVDQVGGVGLLRMLEWEGGTPVEATDLDVTSTPYWMPDGTVVVLVDTGDTIGVAVVDPADGSSEIVLDEAGPADGMRIGADASGTFITWRTSTDVRVLDTRNGDVTVIAPPAGMEVVGGPAFRP